MIYSQSMEDSGIDSDQQKSHPLAQETLSVRDLFFIDLDLDLDGFRKTSTWCCKPIYAMTN